jgi:hypothetical protein
MQLRVSLRFSSTHYGLKMSHAAPPSMKKTIESHAQSQSESAEPKGLRNRDK